jgi:hypothetical protein
MEHSAGRYPWRAYDHYDGTCDYPPVIPYILTLIEALRLAAALPLRDPITIVFMKLPNLLAWVGGALLCLHGLPRLVGWPRARVAAVCYLLAFPLFFNAAIWGQWDALLCLIVLGATLAVLHERLWLAGLLLGVGLAFKLQTILIVPVLLVYGLRRFGLGRLLGPVLAGAVLTGALCLPIVLNGRGDGLMRAAFHLDEDYKKRSVGAYNGWYLLDGFETKVRRIPAELARSDERRVAEGGPRWLTWQRVGQALFIGYVLAVLIALWRRPTRYFLLLSAALVFFAFFFLPTRSHDRYGLPAVALLAVLAPVSFAGRRLFVWLCLTFTANCIVALWRSNLKHLGRLTDDVDRLTLPLAATVSVVHVLLFIWASWLLLRARNAPTLLDNTLDWADTDRADADIASRTRR